MEIMELKNRITEKVTRETQYQIGNHTERIFELEDRVIEIIQFEEKNETRREPQKSVGHNFTNIHEIGVSEGGRRVRKKILEGIIGEISPYFDENIYLHIHKSQ